MPYSGNPANSARDAVFFRVGDTTPSSQDLADAEVDYLLAQNGSNVIAAAIEAARALEAKFAKLADEKTVGDLHITFTKKHERYHNVKMELIQLASGAGPGANPLTNIPVPYAGGLRRSDKEIDRLDDDMEQPDFVRAITDEPLTASTPTDSTLDGQPF